MQVNIFECIKKIYVNKVYTFEKSTYSNNIRYLLTGQEKMYILYTLFLGCFLYTGIYGLWHNGK